METVYSSTGHVSATERLYIEVPGSPDAPDLWLNDQNNNNVNIHWSEPRVYPHVPVTGYQVYSFNFYLKLQNKFTFTCFFF